MMLFLRALDRLRGRRSQRLSALGLLCFAGTALAGAQDQFLTIEAGGHTADVVQVAFSPDGQYLLTAGFDKVVRVWDARGIDSGPARQVGVLRSRIDRGIEGTIYSLAVNSEGIAAVGGVQREVTSTTNHVGPIPTSGTGTRFIIRLFNYRTGKAVKALPVPPSASISALAFSPASGQQNILYSADNNNSGAVNGGNSVIRRWNIQDGKATEVGKHPGAIYTLAVSPDGGRIAAGDVQGNIRIWKTDGGMAAEAKFDRGVNGVAWSPDGSRIAAGQTDGTIRLWNADNLKKGSETWTAKTPGELWGIAFNRNSSQLAVGTRVDQAVSSISVYDAASGGDPKVLPVSVPYLLSVAFSPSTDVVVAGGYGGFLSQWKTTEPAQVSLNSEGLHVNTVMWSPDGNVVGFGQGTTPSLAFSLKEASLGPARGAQWHNAGKEPPGTQKTINDAQNAYRITLGGKNYNLSLDASDWGDQISRVVPLPDGRMIVGSLYNLYLYDKDLKSKVAFLGHQGGITDLAVSPNGQWLVSSSSDQTVRLWNLKAQPRKLGVSETGVEPTLSLFTTQDEQWLAWTPDGYFAASTGAEQFIRLHRNPRNPREEAEAPDVLRQYRDEYRRSDVIARLVTNGGLAQAFKAAQEDKRRQVIEQREAEKRLIAERRKQQEQEQLKLQAEIAAKKAEEERLIREQKAAEAARLKEQRERQEQEQRELAEKQKRLAENQAKVEKKIEQVQAQAQKPVVEAPKPVIEKAKEDPPPNVDLVTPSLEELENRTFRPGQGAVSDKGVLKVTVTVPNATDLSRVRANSLLKPMSKGLESRVKRANQFDLEIQLVAGENRIELFAEREEADGKVVRGEVLPITVFYQPPVEIRRRNLYIIGIGVSQVKSTPELELQFAHLDAVAMVEYYKKLGGPNNLFENVYARILQNAEATKANILEALKYLQQAEPEDVVMVHISGHGDVFVGENQKIPYFLPYDFDPADLEATMLKWSDFLAGINASRAARKLLFADACRSGKIEQAADLEQRRGTAEEMNSATQKSDLLALVSCDSNELSWESEDDKLGFFTASLLDSLQTSKTDDKGFINLFDVNYRVSRLVADKVYELVGESQKPRLLSVNLAGADLKKFLQNFIVSRRGPIQP